VAAEQDIPVALIGGDLLPKEGAFATSLRDQRAFLVDFLGPRLERARAEQPGLRLYWMLGNDDWARNGDVLEAWDAQGLASLLHGRVHEWDDGHALAGYGYVPLTPFSIKDWERFDDAAQPLGDSGFSAYVSTPGGLVRIAVGDLRQHPTIRADLVELAARTEPARTVYVMHAPPWNTALDRLYNGRPIGSRAIRDFILEHQPVATFHGHIHESPRMSGAYHQWLGATLCVNPGQGGTFHYVTCDLSAPGETLCHSVYGPARRDQRQEM
jgi:Icc-related predicted phosphoesterase